MTAKSDTNPGPVVQIQEAHCLRCEHRWKPRIERPVRCPKCQAVNWWRIPKIYVQGQGWIVPTQPEVPGA